MNEYAQRVLDGLRARCAHEGEFLQAAEEILHSLGPLMDSHPEYEHAGLLERFMEPERAIAFRVPWVDDAGRVQVNRGYRVQYSSAIGPYKGGLRFHPNVTLSVMKFLALEQVLKNSLTGLNMGGGKGGSDFDPKGKSDGEVMSFCQSFMAELYRHVGPDTDVPAGDIGVGAREIGYLFGQYKRLTGRFEGVLTGKGLSYGGSLVRKQATGYGLCYLLEAMMQAHGMSPRGMRAVVSGSGNVALYAAEKAQQMGMAVVAMSDSQGYVVDEAGINLAMLRQIKEAERGRISEYARRVPGSHYHEGAAGIWAVACQVALPCATQNELDARAAQRLVSGGLLALAEGANMPLTQEAVGLLQAHGVLYAPGKAANAGGVSVSGLEMSQNATHLCWAFDQVDDRLRDIMHCIFRAIDRAAADCGQPGNYALGANVAGFAKVAEAMMAQGVV
ncbi:MAG: NADP-specific glutamate dehydrogenase [Clostridiales bacterium]|nr:NADP-specific glutamate dehydrogenase [Clostridiales bacterium]